MASTGPELRGLQKSSSSNARPGVAAMARLGALLKGASMSQTLHDALNQTMAFVVFLALMALLWGCP